MSHELVVIGSANMDLIATVDRRPEPGETILGRTFRAAPGGKGANQAIAAARAGGATAFLGAVGSDGFGEQLREGLAAAGVDTAGLRTCEGPSGVAAITVDAAGENSIVVIAGANGAFAGLTEQDRRAVEGAAVLLCQLEIPLATVIEAARAARASGVFVVLNPSPARALPPELLASVDLLIVNETEARQLAARGELRAPHIVTTLGADGARYRGPSGQVHVAAPDVRVVDTTGAGDAFAGAFAVAWAQGQAPESALRWGTTAGALTTERPGAGASAPTRREILGRLAPEI